MLKVLAIIPARKGSKRLPKKNIRMLADKPLLAWSIDILEGIDCIVDILVSTDSREIAQIALDAGALVPWLRPAELATDTATSVDVCLHALDWYEAYQGRVDGVLLLQPTSPFRSRNTLEYALQLYSQNRPCSVISVTPVQSHPAWCFRVKNNRLEPWMIGDGLHLRSQDLDSVYGVNGCIYLVSSELLRKHHAFYVADGRTIPLIMDSPFEGIDIDTAQDWALAEVIAAHWTELKA